MEKSILVLDTPQNCFECRFCNDDRKSFYCIINRKRFESMAIRQDWCPLRPMPEKIDFSNAPSGFNWDVIDGWNWCLEEILGETE